jgi:hypothetical protein
MYEESSVITAAPARDPAALPRPQLCPRPQARAQSRIMIILVFLNRLQAGGRRSTGVGVQDRITAFMPARFRGLGDVNMARLFPDG